MGNRVSAFLRRVPHPVFVMADEQKLQVPNSGNRWRTLTESIHAIDPSRLIALGADGTTLRAITLHEGDDDTPEQRRGTELETFARLLAEAYGKAAVAHAPLVDGAMQFVERLTKRLADTERELERVRHAYAMLLEESANDRAAAAEGGAVGEAVAALASGMLQGQQDAKANGAKR